jgi:hypothetical protein
MYWLDDENVTRGSQELNPLYSLAAVFQYFPSQCSRDFTKQNYHKQWKLTIAFMTWEVSGQPDIVALLSVPRTGAPESKIVIYESMTRWNLQSD